MHRYALGILLVACALGPARRLSAQFPPGERPDGAQREAPRAEGAWLPSPGQLDGPPTPEQAGTPFQLDSSQAVRYRAAWDSLQQRTLPLREGARKQLETVQRAEQAGYTEVAEQQRARLAQLAGALEKEDRRFEKSLHAFFSKEQQKAYEQWRKGEQVKSPDAREDPRRGGHERHSGGRR